MASMGSARTLENSADRRPSKRRRTSRASTSDCDEDEAKETVAYTFEAPSRVQKYSWNQKSAANPSEISARQKSASFTSLPLSPWLQNTLRTLSITNPTPIQENTIPPILFGSDVLASSPTGTGKTLAFALPILHKWSADPSGIYALVLTPTRELALQIFEQFSALGAAQDLKVVLVTGGSEMRPQALALDKRPHVVVATPGRLADHIRQSGDDTVKGLKRVKVVVLDEADRLLDRTARMLDDLGTCLSALPSRTERQTLCYTATMTEEVRALKNMTQSQDRNVFVWELSSEQMTKSITTDSGDQASAPSTTPLIPPTLRQTYLTTPSPQKPAYLHILLTLPTLLPLQTIIFTNRTSTADILHRTLLFLAHKATALHSLLPQQTRNRNLSDFRARKSRILVSTDVGSRGLDIEGVGLVINYDVPRDPDDYVHRVGRTARAGRRGMSLTVVGPRDVDLMQAIESRAGRMEEWREEGVNVETRVVKDGGKILKEVGVARMEALRQVESGRDEKGRVRRIRKARS